MQLQASSRASGLRRAQSGRRVCVRVQAVKDGAALDRPLRVAVIGGGPSGACAAETLAKGGVQVSLIERKMDNCKPCGGAIPLCMVEEFDLPQSIIDRKVTKMKMISPSNREVDVGKTLSETEYIGMCRREVFDQFLRERAEKNGATLVNGLMMRMEQKARPALPVQPRSRGGKRLEGPWDQVPRLRAERRSLHPDPRFAHVVQLVRSGLFGWEDYFAPVMDAITTDDKMKYYENLAEMYVGDDVSPDFYGWVFPKYDHVAVKTEGGKIIRVEAHPIPEHPRPRRIKGRVALVGDAAGYVTKCSGEGIYFAAKSGRMAAEAVVELSKGGKVMCGENAFRQYIDKWDAKYWTTYKVLDILQKVFYRSNPAREAFVELCDDAYVQKMTFDSYLYKTVVPGNPLDDVKLLVRTVTSIVRANALRSKDSNSVNVSFGSGDAEKRVATA
ncbi:geranylgeranyl reductase [Raphidocelis subcapitata]|uniref:Geranylgeranyl reductase n=1 Tax=Raphidocelis subcapitata TaxID=307507 RepID=A0A2V0P2B5_9CHLO|nr:geranylgeranyl reductase [Raphidocelis subcapitata]|eukprot:GBF91337.1 geranylgeranyl reductase [Raphidocelis subcapitata]